MNQAIELLRQTTIEVAAENYHLISLNHDEWRRMLENPELSPRAEAPFLLFKDDFEVTLLLDDVDWRAMRHVARNAKVENGFRLVRLNIELDWNVVGYLALVTKILAEAEIPAGVFSAFSRDYLLIKQQNLPGALKVLGEYVRELC